MTCLNCNGNKCTTFIYKIINKKEKEELKESQEIRIRTLLKHKK